MGNYTSINNLYFQSTRTNASIERIPVALPSATTTTIKAPPIDKLNGDELKEILVRLPVNCLHRCKCVSKKWLALISEPYFVYRYKQLCLNSVSNQDHLMVYSQCDNSLFVLQRFNKLNGSTSIHDKSEISLDFLPITQKHGLRYFKILEFSHGLLFCKAGFRRKRLYVVCNPLTKKWLELPPYYCTKINVSYEGIMCYSLDPLVNQVQFIIVIVENKNSSTKMFFKTNIFFSKTGRWTKFVVACPSGLRWSGLVRLVVCNGMFHWCAGSCIVAYDPLNQPRKCKTINLPTALIESSNLSNSIGVSEGHIRINSTSNVETFMFWELEDYEKEVWCLKYIVGAPITFNKCAFSPLHGEIVYFTVISYDFGSMFILFNTKLGSSVEIYLENHIRYLSRITAQQFVTAQWPTPIPQLPPLTRQTSQLLFCG